ncbi:MAG: succinate dehydrogenase iron-sulfur subunit [Dehalococcoidia bacterium]|nr:succinate dehydrogenase iron-sulfur subunit [Dehalococcoidia bacterium]MSQ16622.1 succinate dehydrogenase iron-sulfur subunit [Dehalococcoidia bacterium]
MDLTVRVKRFNPEAEPRQPYWQDFPISIDENATVLDTLIHIREMVDGTLSLRCSCRSAICGSCAMRINGHAGLACKTKASDAMDKDGMIKVEPAGNMPVVKDLVVNLDLFWRKIVQVEPFLKPQGPEPEAEYVVPNEAMMHLSGVTACIMCGACVSDCTVLEVDPNFLGPAALAKAYRFTADPRDGDGEGVSRERLRKLSDYGGMWDCTRCGECVQACPKGVAPMDRIMALREQAIKAGFDNNNGARHTEAFTESVGHSGSLNELQLPVKTVGITNIPALLGFLPVGLRALTHGKLPPLVHKNIANVEFVRKLHHKLEEHQPEK